MVITVNKIIVFGNILLRRYKCRRHEKVSNKVIICYEINVEQSQNVHRTLYIHEKAMGKDPEVFGAF